MSATHQPHSGDAVASRVVYAGPPERRDRLADRLPAVDVVPDLSALAATSATDPPAGQVVGCAVVEHAPPEHDGFATLRSLRAASPGLPVVFVGDASQLAAALSTGATDFVPAVDGATRLLARRVDSLLESRRNAAGAADTTPDDAFVASPGGTPDDVLRAVTADLGVSYGLLADALGTLDAPDGRSETRSVTTTALADARAATARFGTTLDGLHRYLAVGSPVRCDTVDLSVVVTDALAALGPLGRDTTVLVGDLPTVAGDESLLVALFTELFSNALHYTECAPTVVVDAREGPTAWQIAVTDNGPGLYPSEVEAAFEPFTRFHGDTVPDGVGLGLAVCRRIVAAHGGSIRLDTALGRGSTVVVTLPKRESTGLA